MPRSLSFCYHEICTNLLDLETEYGRTYDSGQCARVLLQELEDGREKDVHRISLRDFVNRFIIDNNNLSLTIASDFNLAP